MSDEMKDYRLTIRLSAELRRRVKEVARSKGKRESDVVRAAIEQRFAAEDHLPSAFERAEKTGLIGAVKKANPDLSTNPKHLDGFGNS